MQGSFCCRQWFQCPRRRATNCSNGSGFTETHGGFVSPSITEPVGVLQQIGSQARFGLSVFNNSGTTMVCKC